MSETTTEESLAAAAGAPGGADTPPEPPRGGPSRPVLLAIWAGVVLVLAAIGAVGVLLFLPARNDASKTVYADKPPPKTAPHVDGLVIKATPQKFELMTRRNERRVMAIRPADRPYLDVQHAQSHAALGQPVRVFYRKVDGKTVAVFLEDSPLIF